MAINKKHVLFTRKENPNDEKLQNKIRSKKKYKKV